MDDLFYTTAAILAVATVVGFIGSRLRQPLIVSFIAVGVVVGPVGVGWVSEAEPLELLAKVGIAVLLFLVGLKLDLHLIRTTGKVAVLTGLGQVLFTSVVGFGLGLALGLSTVAAIYVAVALTFSSTIIIVKLLSDKRELDQLHGRIAIGFLIVQDIVVVLVMIAITAIGGAENASVASEVTEVLAKGVGMLAVLAVLMRWVLPRALALVAGSRELLVISSVAWAVSLAAVSDWLGFSTEVGAFLAGFALASTPFRESLASSLTGLRDFMLLFFFIELGSQLDFSLIGPQVTTAIVLSLFVLIGNPIIVLVIMGALGYPKRVSFLSGLAVAQISEFSLILVALGFTQGHIGNDIVGLVTLVGVITIGLSTYMIIYSHQIFERIGGWLSIFERRRALIVDNGDEREMFDVIVYGFGRFGSNLVEHLVDDGQRVLVIDFDPEAADRVFDGVFDGVSAIYGDAEDVEFPSVLPLDAAKWVISTVPRADINAVLVDSLRRWGFEGRIAVTAHDDAEALRMCELAADTMLQPFVDAADDAIAHLKAFDDTDELI
jgi:Kef-type K+ transport system membrane component KefB